jgi:GNAT superfamily N-acetyltransferase
MAKLTWETRHEYELKAEQKKDIAALLRNCFEDYPAQRCYYKLLPALRLLLNNEDKLLAHLAIEHRVIRIGPKPARIFGVIDLCVAKSHRSMGLASQLLERFEELATASHADFLILFADRHELYKSHGYTLVSNECRFMMVDEHRSLEIADRRFEDCLMIKEIGPITWTKEPVDLLGTVF